MVLIFVVLAEHVFEISWKSSVKLVLAEHVFEISWMMFCEVSPVKKLMSNLNVLCCFHTRGTISLMLLVHQSSSRFFQAQCLLGTE